LSGVRGLVLTLLVGSLFGDPALAVDADGGTKSHSDRAVNALDIKALRRSGEELRDAVIARDVEGLLRYDWRKADVRSGRCKVWAPAGAIGDGTYESDRGLLSDSQSALYCRLFDTGCLKGYARSEHRNLDDPGLRISAVDFFRQNPMTEIHVFPFPSGPWKGTGSIIAYVAPSPATRKLNSLSELQRAAFDQWGRGFMWVELASTSCGWRYLRAPFSYPYDP
jgi:hypothetical protein